MIFLHSLPRIEKLRKKMSASSPLASLVETVQETCEEDVGKKSHKKSRFRLSLSLSLSLPLNLNLEPSSPCDCARSSVVCVFVRRDLCFSSRRDRQFSYVPWHCRRDVEIGRHRASRWKIVTSILCCPCCIIVSSSLIINRCRGSVVQLAGAAFSRLQQRSTGRRSKMDAGFISFPSFFFFFFLPLQLLPDLLLLLQNAFSRSSSRMAACITYVFSSLPATGILWKHSNSQTCLERIAYSNLSVQGYGISRAWISFYFVQVQTFLLCSAV